MVGPDQEAFPETDEANHIRGSVWQDPQIPQERAYYSLSHLTEY